MSNQEEVELRAKIEALGLEVTKVPQQAPKQLDEVTAIILLPHLVIIPLSTGPCLTVSLCFVQLSLQLEIAAELDRLSARLENVDKMISSAMTSDPEVKSLLSSTADVWMPVITASADERRGFAGTSGDLEEQEKSK
jgi:hypothetical protein